MKPKGTYLRWDDLITRERLLFCCFFLRSNQVFRATGPQRLPLMANATRSFVVEQDQKETSQLKSQRLNENQWEPTFVEMIWWHENDCFGQVFCATGPQRLQSGGQLGGRGRGASGGPSNVPIGFYGPRRGRRDAGAARRFHGRRPTDLPVRRSVRFIPYYLPVNPSLSFLPY